MNYNYRDYFKNTILPDGLSEVELHKYIELAHKGNKEAREIVIINNTKLTIFLLNKYFSTLDIDKREVTSIAMEALIECIDNFDYSKGNSFSSCLKVYITYKVYKYLNKLNKSNKLLLESLEDDNIKNILYNLVYNSSIEDNLIKKELYIRIKEYLNNLDDYNRDILEMYYGFNGIRYTQEEIASKYNLTRSRIGQIISKETKKIGTYLLNNGYYEKKSRTV
jgi:RNA polymerase sigma factor (sigma-70 family)